MADKMKLGELLINKGFLSEEKLLLALSYQKITDTLIGEALIKLGFNSSLEIAKALAEQAGIPFLDLSEYSVNEEAIRLIPKNIAEANGFIPLRFDDAEIEIGMLNPSDITVLDTVKKLTGKTPRVFMVDKVSFNESIERAYFFLENPIRKHIDNAIAEIKSSATINASTVAELSEYLIIEGIRRNATDIHISPEHEIMNVFYRVDGVMHYGFSIPKVAHNGIALRLKVQAKLDISEQRLPQDGSFNLNLLNTKYELRVATTPTIFGENIVIRVLADTGQLLRLNSLGFDEANTVRLQQLFQKPHGIILTTGPASSGKTATLYAALREINLIERNVLTVEDPVEYKLSFVKQSSINIKAGYDFFVAGRNFMRQDPDVMLLGEIRDEETAQIATRASITGHLVLSTLRSNDAVTSIPRLLDFKVDKFMVSSSLLAVVAQRLVRKLCRNCMEKHEITEEEINAFELSKSEEEFVDMAMLKTAYRAKGCKDCEDGYMGRTIVGEIMIVNEEIRELISEGASLGKIKEAALKNGMVPMKVSAMKKVMEGVTSFEEIIRVVQ